MKNFIYLIVWCAIIVNENRSLPIETSKNGPVETIITPPSSERNTTPLTSFSIENTTNPEPNNRDKTVTNSTPANAETPTDHHHKITTKPSDKNKQPKVSVSTKSGEKIATSKSTTTSTPSSSHSEKERSDPDSIHLPPYAIGLIMFTMAIMFFIILALLFVLYFKIKQDKRHRDSMDVAIQPKNEMNYKYSRQLSGETSNISTLLKDKTKDSKLILTRSDSKALFFNNLDTVDATKEKSLIDDKKTSKITMPESNPTKAKEGQPTLTRVLKQPSTNYVPISHEQMLKLCEGVLSKTKKTHETSKEEKGKVDLKKCLSTPELDSDMYDMLPTSSPRKFFNSSDFNNEEFDDEVYDNPPKHKIKKCDNHLNKHNNEEFDDAVYDSPVSNKHDNEVFDDGVYDNPPLNHNRKRNFVVSTDHEEYVMPLTNDNGLYCNAKSYADNKIISDDVV